MCGRFTLTRPPEKGSLRFPDGEATALAPRYNIAPTQYHPVMRQDEAGVYYLHSWGLVPHWAKEKKLAWSMINARAESLREKPAFRNLLSRRRCLVPADGFYEWKQKGKAKQPWRILLCSGEPFFFAGLWDEWRAPEGQSHHSFTIITTEANELMAPIHDRMPAILGPSEAEQWLRLPDVEDALALLRPYPAEFMTAYPVPAAVGNVRNDSPELIEAVGED